MPIEPNEQQSIIESVMQIIKKDFAPLNHHHNGADSPRLLLSDLDIGGNVSSSTFSHNLTFSGTDTDTVQWTSGTISLDSGQDYAIGLGNTGNMTARTYIHLDTVTSVTALQTSTTYSDAVGNKKILIGIAENVSRGSANFQVFTGGGGIQESFKNSPYDINLVGLWSFDESTGLVVFDHTTNDNRGDLKGSMTESDWIQGISGFALDFDGNNDYVTIADATVLDFTSNFSISFWLKPDGFNPAAGLVTKSGASPAASTNYAVFILTTGALQLKIKDSGGSTNNMTSTTTIGTGTWKHIVVTYDEAVTNFYIDGVPDAGNPQTSAFTLVANSNALLIGAWDEDGTIGSHFDGQIDEVRLYNTILTEEEVRALFDNPAGQRLTDPTSVGGKFGNDVGLRSFRTYEKGIFDGAPNDGLTAEAVGVGSNSIARNDLITRILGAGSSGSEGTERLYGQEIGNTNTGEPDWDGDFELVFPCFVENNAGETRAKYAFVGLFNTIGQHHNDVTLTTRHIGIFFEIESGGGGTIKLHASNADGTTQKITEITGYTLTSRIVVRIIVDASTDIKFYVNDILEVTETSNRPSGSTDLPRQNYSMTGLGNDASLYLYNNYRVLEL